MTLYNVTTHGLKVSNENVNKSSEHNVQFTPPARHVKTVLSVSCLAV